MHQASLVPTPTSKFFPAKVLRDTWARMAPAKTIINIQTDRGRFAWNPEEEKFYAPGSFSDFLVWTPDHFITTLLQNKALGLWIATLNDDHIAMGVDFLLQHHPACMIDPCGKSTLDPKPCGEDVVTEEVPVSHKFLLRARGEVLLYRHVWKKETQVAKFHISEYLSFLPLCLHNRCFGHYGIITFGKNKVVSFLEALGRQCWNLDNAARTLNLTSSSPLKRRMMRDNSEHTLWFFNWLSHTTESKQRLEFLKEFWTHSLFFPFLSLQEAHYFLQKDSSTSPPLLVLFSTRHAGVLSLVFRKKGVNKTFVLRATIHPSKKNTIRIVHPVTEKDMDVPVSELASLPNL